MKEIEPLNHAYYAQSLPCPFLEDEICSIYEFRPAACRELLVTSPQELCQNMATNPIRALPVHLRMGTILSLLWKEFTQGPARLIPLPLAIDWAERHRSENTHSLDRSPTIGKRNELHVGIFTAEFSMVTKT